MGDIFARILGMLHSANSSVAGLGVLVFLVGCAAHYLIICQRSGKPASIRGLFNFTFPLKRLLTTTTRIDLVFYVFSKVAHHLRVVTNIALTVLVSHLIGAALAGQFDDAPLRPDLPIVALAYALAFVPRDFAHYWVHYLHHKVPALWEFHKVHHSATYLTPLTTERTHPVEDQIFALAEGLAMGLALGLLRARYAFSDADILVIAPTAIWTARMLALTPLQHSQVPVHFGILDRIVYSPSLHHVHHSCETAHWDRNFAECLSLWDSLFGTYHPLGQDKVTLGLLPDEQQHYGSLLACYVRPFMRIFQMVVARPGAVPGGEFLAGEIANPSQGSEISMNLSAPARQS